jgi:hypothetical protein
MGTIGEDYMDIINWRVNRKEEIRQYLIQAEQARIDPSRLWDQLEREQGILLQLQKGRDQIAQQLAKGQSGSMDAYIRAAGQMRVAETQSRSRERVAGAEIEADLRQRFDRELDKVKRSVESAGEAAHEQLMEAVKGEDSPETRQGHFRTQADTLWDEGYAYAFDNANDAGKAIIAREFANVLGFAAGRAGVAIDPDSLAQNKSGLNPNTFSEGSIQALTDFERDKTVSEATRGLGAGYGGIDMPEDSAAEQASAALRASIAGRDEEIEAQRERIRQLRAQIDAKPEDIDLAEIERQSRIAYAETYGSPRSKRLLAEERARQAAPAPAPAPPMPEAAPPPPPPAEAPGAPSADFSRLNAATQQLATAGVVQPLTAAPTNQQRAEYVLARALEQNPELATDDVGRQELAAVGRYIMDMDPTHIDYDATINMADEYVVDPGGLGPRDLLRGLRQVGDEAIVAGEQSLTRQEARGARQISFQKPEAVAQTATEIERDRHVGAAEVGAQAAAEAHSENSDIIDKVIEHLKRRKGGGKVPPKVLALIKENADQILALAKNPGTQGEQEVFLKRLFEDDWSDPDVKMAARAALSAFSEIPPNVR